MSRILIALGGNALGSTPQEQQQLVHGAAKPIVDLIDQGHDVVIAHGNGPQVGSINLAFEKSSKEHASISSMPFAECVAMSQGYIGYHLQNAIQEELLKRSINKSVATIVSQVVVDKNDHAFQNPTKQIGSFYSKEEAQRLMAETSDIYIEDSGRGYRRVIPSPVPIKIVEKDIINDLVNAGRIVIAVGGGGIPVVEENNHSLIGVEAVIDKDLASRCLADELNADFLFILTAVEKIAINFGKPNQQNLDYLSVDEAEKLIREGHFAPGSMLPKVQAAISFVRGKQGRKSIITSLDKAKDAILGRTGTVIFD